MIDDKQLISKLLASELIDQEGLREGLDLAEKHGATLYETLIYDGLVDEYEVVDLASKILNVPSVHLMEAGIDRDVAQMISAKMAAETQSVPVEVIDDGGMDVLKLAMSDPIDVMAMDEVASHTGIDIQPVLAGPADIETAIETLYDIGDDEEVIELDEVADVEEIVELDEVVELEEVSDDFDEDSGGGFDFEDDDEAIEVDDEFDFEDDDEAIELDDAFAFDDEEGAFDEELELGSDEHLIDDAVDDDGPALVEAPEGLVNDEDSWAAMFDEAEEVGDSRTSESDDDDAALSVPPAMEQADASTTQIGSPARIGTWGDDDLADDSETASGDDEASGVDAAESEPWEIEAIDDGESSASEDEDRDDRGDAAGDDDENVVPKSIRDVLNKTKTKGKDSDGPRLPRPPEVATKDEAEEGDDIANDVGSASSQQEAKGDRPNTLGRIEVKKMPVRSSSFKGAIEKRSDRSGGDMRHHSSSTPETSKAKGTSTSSGQASTREMSVGELTDLARESGEKRESASAVEIPDDVDSERLLRRLIELMVDRDLVSVEEVAELVEDVS